MEYYQDYLSPEMYQHLKKTATPVAGIAGLTQLGENRGLETPEALKFLVELYQTLAPELASVLKRRTLDRSFIDQRVAALYEFNQKEGVDYLSVNYQTILGLEDGEGRIVVGPKRADYVKKGGQPIAPLPEYLTGAHVTLFGPPDSAKLAINAMNAYHRQLPGEPAIVGELLSRSKNNPMWGADDEDSKTPLRSDLVSAGVNLTGCFTGRLSEVDERTGKVYKINSQNQALPLKRFPGLALPSFFLFFNDQPIPLHLYDFALHFFHHIHNPRALVFYVPKLENEEEARYIRLMMETAEKMAQKIDPKYKMGTIRLMIVLENPRAIFRAHEIMDELYPYFVGASLGWHDYLASTARLFKEDGNYRIPVKADPNIVIKYIKASHRLLADVVGPRGGIKVGGMYGILPVGSDIKSDSFQITLKGYFKDVITQMKRDLTGFWVAHPDFVRLGIAMVEAWKDYQSGQKSSLKTLVDELLSPKYASEIWTFIEGPDIEGLDVDDPLYARSLIVADVRESNYIANNHPDEVRYNVFQCLQYLADWLTGSGCVALPAQIENVAVRVMDDLATTERSRWEVWHEIRHGRFQLEDLIQIAFEEMTFIRKDLSDEKKIVQVKYDERTAKWYPVAFKLMLRLMTDEKPVEFATELLLPFTVDVIREAHEPWQKALELDQKKFKLNSHVEKITHAFEALGSMKLAKVLAGQTVFDPAEGFVVVESFNLNDIEYAASFHGDIGESKKSLDAHAANEQAKVFDADVAIKSELKRWGADYKKKFGMKFLISAKDKSASDLLAALQNRMNNSQATEERNAKAALWEIAIKRLSSKASVTQFETILSKHQVKGAQITITHPFGEQTLSLGTSDGAKPVTDETMFEIASLSKSIGVAFALEWFKVQGISLDTKVNELLAKTKSSYRIPGEWGGHVTLTHLMNHHALNLHYVNGVPGNESMPSIEEFLNGNPKYGYEAIQVVNPPGTKFKYSGAGFIVLEHVLEALSGKKFVELTHEFLIKNELSEIKFETPQNPAHGFRGANKVPGDFLNFPRIAAGAFGTTRALQTFLKHLTQAYHSLSGSGAISHYTARLMLWAKDDGCREFMGCDMGLGIFVLEGGQNKWTLHQGANDGFRCLFLHCFHGPDQGKGLSILCNGELNGVQFIAEATQEILKLLSPQGIDPNLFKAGFSTEKLKQEEVVNTGYRELIFKAFEPRLPETIIKKGSPDPLAKYNLCVGGKIERVTNQLFARAENLLSDHEPIFDPELFGREGKIMDSWETVRHNAHHDELEFALKAPSTIHYVSLSTKYHFGNHAPAVRLEGLVNGQWQELLARVELEGHALMRIKLPETKTVYSKIKVQMFPDGGLSRLGLYKELPANVAIEFKTWDKRQSVKFSEKIPHTKKPLSLPFKTTTEKIQQRLKKSGLVDLASKALGADVISASNEHYGPAAQVISPYRPLNMFDGMESARSRIPGHHEEVTIRLAKSARLERIELDYSYFVNNNPMHVCIEGKVADKWQTLVPKTLAKCFAGNKQDFKLKLTEEVSELRVKAYPCGGLNRVHAWGRV